MGAFWRRTLLQIHTFGAKSLRPLQNPDRTHMDRYAILERAEATFKPSSYGFKLNLFDGEAAFDITHLGILEEKSLRLWMVRNFNYPTNVNVPELPRTVQSHSQFNRKI